jgi:thioesterase domain-containing protein
VSPAAPPHVLGWSYGAARAQQGQARDVTVDRAVARKQRYFASYTFTKDRG